MKQPNLQSERRRLIRLELKAHGVCAVDRWKQLESLVDACYRVMTSAPHENRLPSTGVVLLSHPFEEYRFNKKGRFVDRSLDEDTCWRLADGIHSFVVKYEENVRLFILNQPAVDEVALFSFRDDLLF